MKVLFKGKTYNVIANEKGHAVSDSEGDNIFFGPSLDKILVGEVVNLANGCSEYVEEVIEDAVFTEV